MRLVKPPKDGPKVLLYDIETAPILANVWRIWETNVGLNQIDRDWHILSWSAKWLGKPTVMYKDQRNAKKIEDDKALIKPLWTLLDQADIVVTQNGISFDDKKVNARFIHHNMQPPSSFKQVDTKRIAKRKFGFTSNKLEYMAKYLGVEHRKLTVRKFDGFELWKECMAGNVEAWKEMEKYNRLDTIVLEEIYKKLIPWDNRINFGLYYNKPTNACSCGSTTFVKNGFAYTPTGRYQRYRCGSCGAEARGRSNVLIKKDRKNLLKMG